MHAYSITLIIDDNVNLTVKESSADNLKSAKLYARRMQRVYSAQATVDAIVCLCEAIVWSHRHIRLHSRPIEAKDTARIVATNARGKYCEKVGALAAALGRSVKAINQVRQRVRNKIK
jgi:uncharacterized metal-binding protein